MKTDKEIKRLLNLWGGTPYNLLLLEIITKEEYQRYIKKYGN